MKIGQDKVISLSNAVENYVKRCTRIEGLSFADIKQAKAAKSVIVTCLVSALQGIFLN